MKIKSMTADRKNLSNALGKHLGIKPDYLGAPTFKYQVGDYTVMKDGSLEVDDDKADITLLRTLHTEGLIDNSWDEEREVIEVKLPYDGHTGSSLTNLTFMVASRSKLINRSIRCLEAFTINERFIEALMEAAPETVEDFMAVVEKVDANSTNTGLEFLPDGISFSGFPAVEDAEVIRAYMDLASLMNQMSIKQKRVQATAIETDNEKYAFRTWLMRLGMMGEKYKNTRKHLLANLPGNCAFRTEAQAEAFKESHRVKKEEVNE